MDEVDDDIFEFINYRFIILYLNIPDIKNTSV